MSNPVLVIGSINADLVLGVDRHPRPGETLAGRTKGMTPGGKGANQAVAAARLGADVSMIGAIGTDHAAEVAQSVLRDDGVDLRDVRTVAGPTGLAVVTVDSHGENTIIVVPGANTTVDAHLVREAPRLDRAALVVAQGEIPADAVDEIAQRTTGRFILNLAPVIPVRAGTLERADPLVVNEHEARLVCSQSRPNRPGPSSDREAVTMLLEIGARTVVLTRGAQGAIVGAPDGITEVPSPTVDAVDTTGAGDAFVGALAAGLATGQHLVDAARRAAKVGAHACTREGAQSSYPSRRDLEELA